MAAPGGVNRVLTFACRSLTVIVIAILSAFALKPGGANASQLTITNDTGLPASAVHIYISGGDCIDFSSETDCGPQTTFAPFSVSISHNPSGCPLPAVTRYSSLEYDFVWPMAL